MFERGQRWTGSEQSDVPIKDRRACGNLFACVFQVFLHICVRVCMCAFVYDEGHDTHPAAAAAG